MVEGALQVLERAGGGAGGSLSVYVFITDIHLLILCLHIFAPHLYVLRLMLR